MESNGILSFRRYDLGRDFLGIVRLLTGFFYDDVGLVVREYRGKSSKLWRLEGGFRIVFHGL